MTAHSGEAEAPVDPARHGQDWTAATTEPVAPGVHRIPLPLPGDGLVAVNVYALDDGTGVTLVDAGWGITAARTALEDGLARIDRELGDVRAFLVTHQHRDHFELAIEVRRLFGSRVHLGRGERVALEWLRTQGPGGALLARIRAGGATALVDELQRTNPLGRGDVDWELPDDWLDDGRRLDVDGRRLEVVATPGHTRGHVVFVDRAAGLLFAGDHVLPHITPSIGFEAVPADSPLVDYLASLARVRDLPDLRLLPAHGPVRPTTHDRVDALLVHHEHRLDASLAAVSGGAATAAEVAAVIPWTRRERRFADLDVLNRVLAVNETLAHLDALVARGLLAMVDEDGVCTYSTT